MGGRNIYPTDIERAASGADGRAGGQRRRRAAGGRRRPAPRVVPRGRGVAARRRSRRRCRGSAKDVTSRVVSAVGVRPAEVVVLRPGSLPKTPSGKLRRAATRALLAARGSAGERSGVVHSGRFAQRRVSRQRVEPVLRGLQAVAQQRLRRVRGQVDRELQLLALRAGEPLEHEVGRVLAARRAADAEADAQVVLRPDRRADRPQPVVAALAAALLEAHDAEPEVQVVVHHHQVRGLRRRSTAAARRPGRRRRSCTSAARRAPRDGRRAGPPARPRSPLCLENRPPPARAASSSTTRTPTLCRVSAYSGPGIAEPDHQCGARRHRISPRRSAAGLAEGGSSTTPAPSVSIEASTCGRGRRGDDVDDQDLGVRAQRGALGQRDVRGVDLGAGGEALDGHLDLLGDARDVRLDLDRVQLLGDQGVRPRPRR